MTERNKLLRDALRRVETVAQTALAHQPDGEAECYRYLVDSVLSVIGESQNAINKICDLDNLEMKGKTK